MEHLEFLSISNLLCCFQSLLHKNFAQTDLGELYQAIPFESFAQTIPAPAFAKSNLGRKPWFDVKGGIGLLILKHYTGLSDALLIERINTDWAMQLFCGIQLKPGQQIKDINQPSFWRTYIGKYLDIERLQQSAAQYWKPWMQQTNTGMQDTKKLRIKLVKFLLKLLQQMGHLQSKYNTILSDKKRKQLRNILTVYQQQHGKLYGDTTIIKDRIVSLSKPYIRPIVRGKEVRQVEFGAKVNVL